MACKKSDLVSAINSYASARLTGDGNLLKMSGDLLSSLIESLEFEPEETLEQDTDGDSAD
jgi:hypothetical protein